MLAAFLRSSANANNSILVNDIHEPFYVCYFLPLELENYNIVGFCLCVSLL